MPMKYSNPVIKGFYPDPSVCRANGRHYLVCSSMQYFPGVPLFESSDLVNWKQIGHCLTRPSQIQLERVSSSGGVFAPTIRYHEGRFYMTTTNDTTHQNFYVWTDDIYGEWSEPVFVEQGGIDPSLLFDGGRIYFMSNGQDDNGINGITMCEIDIDSGKKLTPSRSIWQGTGGRYLEGPHLYKIKDRYLLLAAEGGTEYGHMVTYAVSDSPFGDYTEYPHNPVLTNRNLGGYEVQGVGHGDLIQDNDSNWWLIHLGFRQSGRWMTYHHLGRETFLTPVTFNEDGWFTAGYKGTVLGEFDTGRISDDITQNVKNLYTFENTDWDKDWCYLRIPHRENYITCSDKLTLKGTAITLDEADSPTFIGIRQCEFKADFSCSVTVDHGEAGITFYMDENHHYDLALRRAESGYEVALRLNIGDIKTVVKSVPVDGNSAELIIHADNYTYSFGLKKGAEEICLGTAQTRYLSSEVAGGFTGVVIGLYAYCDSSGNQAEFSDFKCAYR